MPLFQQGTTSNIQVPRITPGTTGQETKVNDANTITSTVAQLHVKSRTTTTAPGSPAQEDAYIVPASSSGYTGAATDDVAIYSNGWTKQTPLDGWEAWVEDETIKLRFRTGIGWVDVPDIGSVEKAITASTTQTQGQRPLVSSLNQVSTVTVANDVVTLPVARKGRICVVANDALVMTLQVFPASGDAIDAGAANASTTILAGKRKLFMAIDSTTWLSFLGA